MCNIVPVSLGDAKTPPPQPPSPKGGGGSKTGQREGVPIPYASGSPSPFRGGGWGVGSSALGFLLMAVIGCSPAVPSSTPKEKTDPGEVSVVHPQRKSLIRRIEQPGAIMPLEEAHLHARVPGNVAEVHLDIGQPVEKASVVRE